MIRRASREVRSLGVLDLLLLAGLGGLVAATRRYADLHLGIPGHTGVLWMFLLVLGRARVQRDGAGLVVGASTALWGLPFGLGHSFFYNMGLYSVAGVAVDIAAGLPRVRLAHPLGGMLAGALAHGAKFLFIFGYAVVLDAPRHFYVVGILRAFGYHLMFGAAGGLLASLVLLSVFRMTHKQPGRGCGP